MPDAQNLIAEARALREGWAGKLAELQALDIRTQEGRAKVLVLRERMRPAVRRLTEIARALGSPIPDVEL